MNAIALRCFMLGLVFLRTLAADVNVTFVPDHEARHVTCSVSHHTGDLELLTMQVVKLRTNSTAAEMIASLNVSDTIGTMEFDPAFYQDQDVDLPTHYVVYMTKVMTTYVLSGSSSMRDDEEADYQCVVKYKVKGLENSETKSVHLDFKGSSTTNQGTDMSSNEKRLTACFVVTSTAFLIAITAIVAYYKRKLNNTYIMSYNMHIVELAREEADKVLIQQLRNQLNASQNMPPELAATSTPYPMAQELSAASTPSVSKQQAERLIPSRGIQRKLAAARIPGQRMMELAAKIIPDSTMQQQLAAASASFSNEPGCLADVENPPHSAEPQSAESLKTLESTPTVVTRRVQKVRRPMGPPPPPPPPKP